jgi:hypothetical protein
VELGRPRLHRKAQVFRHQLDSTHPHQRQVVLYEVLQPRKLRLDLRQRLGHDSQTAGSGLLEFLGQEVDVQEDRAQGIADFVGDPGRQAAQEGEVLGALRLAFQTLALGNFVVQGRGTFLEALFESLQTLRVQERVIPRLQERLADVGQEASIHAQSRPFDRLLQARHLPDRLGRQPHMRGRVLQ